MSIRIEMVIENDNDLKAHLRSLAPIIGLLVETQDGPPAVTLSLQETLEAAPLALVRELVDKIFDAQGFEVVIKAKEGQPEAEAAEAEPTEAPKTTRKRGGGRPPLVDAKTAAEKLKGNGEAAPEPEVDPIGSTPEQDRDFVLDGLGKIIADPKRKAAAMTFAARIAKENGTDKLTKLTADKFPTIRVDMEKEFPSG